MPVHQRTLQLIPSGAGAKSKSSGQVLVADERVRTQGEPAYAMRSSQQASWGRRALRVSSAGARTRLRLIARLPQRQLG